MLGGVASQRLGLTLLGESARLRLPAPEAGWEAGIAVASIGAYSVTSFKAWVDTQGGVDELV